MHAHRIPNPSWTRGDHYPLHNGGNLQNLRDIERLAGGFGNHRTDRSHAIPTLLQMDNRRSCGRCRLGHQRKRRAGPVATRRDVSGFDPDPCFGGGAHWSALARPGRTTKARRLARLSCHNPSISKNVRDAAPGDIEGSKPWRRGCYQGRNAPQFLICELPEWHRSQGHRWIRRGQALARRRPAPCRPGLEAVQDRLTSPLT